MYFIDLFAGAGGLSEGFIKAGFEPIAHIEMNGDACNTLKTRAAFHYLKANDKLDKYTEYLKNKKPKEDGSKLWSQVPKGVTNSVIQEAIGEDTLQSLFERVDRLIDEKVVDIIVGGPPCQAYSLAGRSRKGSAMHTDPRTELYKYYVNFLERYQPKMFVFENVLGIKTSKNGEHFRNLQKLVRGLGYEIEAKEQVASNFGVLQNRHRMIIVGWKSELNLTYPEFNIVPVKHEVLKDLFADLPTRLQGEGDMLELVNYTTPLSKMPYLKESGIRGEFNYTTQHIARPHNINDREIYLLAVDKWLNKRERLQYKDIPERLQTHKNKEAFQNRFQVVDNIGCSHTVVAHIAKDGHYYIYPTANPTIDNVRSITVREAARLQSFPDDYFFEGSRGAAFKQIGNAVPVVMAEKIALTIKELIDGIE